MDGTAALPLVLCVVLPFHSNSLQTSFSAMSSQSNISLHPHPLIAQQAGPKQEENCQDGRKRVFCKTLRKFESLLGVHFTATENSTIILFVVITNFPSFPRLYTCILTVGLTLILML